MIMNLKRIFVKIKYICEKKEIFLRFLLQLTPVQEENKIIEAGPLINNSKLKSTNLFKKIFSKKFRRHIERLIDTYLYIQKS